MKPFRILIADDEPLARSGLTRMIAHDPDFELIGECADGIEALAAIRKGRPDLVLLDIEMPGRDGFAVLTSLAPEERPLAIFVTAYDAHALRAFDVNAVDYVLKPVVQERLGAALARAAARLRESGRRSALSTQDLERLAALVRTRPPYLERFLVRSPSGGTVVPASEVLYIEADGDYVRLHRGQSHELMRATLHSLLERLDPSLFVRIHRSYVARLDRITRIDGAAGGDGSVILDDDTELPLSRTYRESLLAALDRR
jgi:two-component system, LytTR family, response regulator